MTEITLTVPDPSAVPPKVMIACGVSCGVLAWYLFAVFLVRRTRYGYLSTKWSGEPDEFGRLMTWVFSPVVLPAVLVFLSVRWFVCRVLIARGA